MEPIELRPRNVGAWLVAIVVLLAFALPVAATGKVGAEVFAAIVAIVTITIVLLLYRRRIVVDAAGVTRHGIRTTQIRWDDVAYYLYWTARGLDGTAHTSKNPARQFAAIKIVAVDRTKVAIDSRWRQPRHAVEYAIEEIHARLKVTGFEPFTIEDGALLHTKRGRIDFSDIERIVVTADQLSVRRRGKTLEWAGSEFKKLVNTLLFLERLTESGVNVIVTGGQFLPPGVVDRMRAARDRVANQKANE